MLRKSFRMSVNARQEAENRRRHNPICRDLEDVLLPHAVLTYSIFVDPATGGIFAHVEIEDEARWQVIVQTDVCQRCWRFMLEIMPANPDDRMVFATAEDGFLVVGGVGSGEHTLVRQDH